MKPVQFTIIAFLLLSVVSCRRLDISENLPDQQTFEKVYLTFRASSGERNDTKTILESNSLISWLPKDAINLFYGELYSGKFVSTLQEEDAVSEFNGFLNVATGTSLEGGAARKFWAVYPYNSINTCDGSSVQLSIPSKQKGVPGTFANKLNPSVASSNGVDLAFYNVGSWFRFSVSNSDIASVTFKGNNNEFVAGRLKVSMDSNGKPVSQVLEGKRSITITPAEGEAFVAGEEYYIVLVPQNNMPAGYTVTYTKTDGTSADFVKNGSSVFERSHSRTKFNGDNGLTFSQVEGGESLLEDLSEMGSANSYIVSAAGSYSFNAVKGNSGIPVEGIQGVKVLWESFGTAVKPVLGDIINPNVTYSDGVIQFSTNESFHEGNALIAAYSDADCTDGNVLWSWHIWCTDQPKEQVYHNNAGTMMDRNLGATSATPGDLGAIGLFYQWGRKDPFLGPRALKSSLIAAYVYNTAKGTWPSRDGSLNAMTIEYSIANPTTFIGYNSLNQDWFYTNSTLTDNTRWESTKTQYDPCPSGWRVPDGGKTGTWAIALGSYMKTSNATFDNTNVGFQLGGSAAVSLGESESIWYPLTGKYSFSSSEYSYGSTVGYYWTCTPCDYDARAFVNYTSTSELYPANELQGYRAGAGAVRCIQE